MIRDKVLWEQWEREQLKRAPADLMHNLRLIEEMYREALTLGVICAREATEGLDEKIALARVLNVHGAPGTDRAGA